MAPFRRKATTASPRPRTRTEQQTEADARAYETQKRTAGRQAARCLLILRHGCTGRSCASDRHAGDLTMFREALMCLGVIPDPQAQWTAGDGYTGAPKRRDGAAS